MTDLIVKAVETEAEYEATWRLVLGVFRDHFTEEDVVESIERARQEPDFDFAKHQIVVVKGEIVSHVLAHDYRLRYGESELRMGAIGAVCTHPDHRKKGYALAAMNKTLDFMQARGDQVALLVTGQVDFYSRMGYHTVWSDSSMEIEAVDAAALAAPLTVRAAIPDDLPQMAALYDRHWGERITMPRSAETWEWYAFKRPERLLRVVESGRGELLAYAASHGMSPGGFEVVADTQDALGSLLAHLGQIALNEGWEKLEMLVHPDEDLLHYTRRLTSCVLTTEYTYHSNWMGRLVNADSFREAILPEITRQAGIDTRGLIFSIQPDAVDIGLRGQDSTNARLDMETFLQVAFGSLPPRVLPLHADAVQLLERLFPGRPLMIAPLDWF